MSRDLRKGTIDAITEINKESYEEFHDPETLARISQYEMAFRMQTTVPEVMDITKEPAYIHEMYGTQLGKESFANNCLLARKLVEQGVRFVQLFDWGWDSHGGGSEDTDVANGLTKKCSTVDKAITALIQDLKQRGLLDETLIVWGQNLGEPLWQKTAKVKQQPSKEETTIPKRSPFGWQAEASRAAIHTAKQILWAMSASKTVLLFLIYKQPSCTV
jgi:membrane-anchored protein YejM (alkaline phosphatase superfamily)